MDTYEFVVRYELKNEQLIPFQYEKAKHVHPNIFLRARMTNELSMFQKTRFFIFILELFLFHFFLTHCRWWDAAQITRGLKSQKSFNFEAIRCSQIPLIILRKFPNYYFITAVLSKKFSYQEYRANTLVSSINDHCQQGILAYNPTVKGIISLICITRDTSPILCLFCYLKIYTF